MNYQIKGSERRILSVIGWVSLCMSVLCLISAPSGPSAGLARGVDDVPDYTASAQSYRVPFTRPVNFQNLTSLHVRASLNGGPATSFQVDTGSVGIVVSADEVPNIEPNAPAGVIKYSSSGIELYGVWTKATVTFPGAKDAQGHLATAVVPVLAVKERKVTGMGVNSAGRTPSLHPKVHMFGIGFGRGTEAHPERNPFINLKEMQAGTMRRGYTITRDGFTLGLTAESVGKGYVYQKLTERAVSAETTALKPGLKDWQTAPGTFSVASVQAPMGTVLMDTGLTNMMLATTEGSKQGDVPAGTKITIDLLGGKLHYSFKVAPEATAKATPATGTTTGEEAPEVQATPTKDPVAPRRVTWIRPTHGVFVNTGLRALAAFDYLYDAEGGYLGLRPVPSKKE